MKARLIPALIFLFILTVANPQPGEATKYEAVKGLPGMCLSETSILINGVDISNRVNTFHRDGEFHVPLRDVIEKTGGYVLWDQANRCVIVKTAGIALSVSPDLGIIPRPFTDHGVFYVPLQFFSEISGLTILNVEEAQAVAIFSKSPTKLEQIEKQDIMNKMQEYLSLDIHQLPCDREKLINIYAEYIDQDSLYSFVDVMYSAISNPTSWGGIAYVDGGLVAATTDTAVAQYKIKLFDGENEGYLYGVQGFKKRDNGWFLTW